MSANVFEDNVLHFQDAEQLFDWGSSEQGASACIQGPWHI
jgi:hypothetical protein